MQFPCALSALRVLTSLCVYRIVSEDTEGARSCSAEDKSTHSVPPAWIVMYDSLVLGIEPFLRQHGYVEAARFAHTLTDERFVLLFERAAV